MNFMSIVAHSGLHKGALGHFVYEHYGFQTKIKAIPCFTLIVYSYWLSFSGKCGMTECAHYVLRSRCVHIQILCASYLFHDDEMDEYNIHTDVICSCEVVIGSSIGWDGQCDRTDRVQDGLYTHHLHHVAPVITVRHLVSELAFDIHSFQEARSGYVNHVTAKHRTL